MTRATILHACGHKARHAINGGTATTRSGQMFDLATQDCPDCATDADAAEADAAERADELAARRAA